MRKLWYTRRFPMLYILGYLYSKGSKMFIILAILAAILPTCQSEDSTNCYWNASISGNGLGSSFIDLNGKVTYLD